MPEAQVRVREPVWTLFPLTHRKPLLSNSEAMTDAFTILSEKTTVKVFLLIFKSVYFYFFISAYKSLPNVLNFSFERKSAL